MTKSNFVRQHLSVNSSLATKWSYTVLEEGYVPMPKMFIRTLSTILGDVRDLQVILAIVDYKRPNLTRKPSLEYLSFLAGLDVDLFRRRIEEMRLKNWLLVSGSDSEMEISLDPLLKLIEEKAAAQDKEYANSSDEVSDSNTELPY